jgi:hypothetical protein
MNNMFEYLAGGQCYTCGGKVRYNEGGYTEDQQQSPIADMGQPMRQPMRQPSTLDANAKQLMKFLLEQLSKGTSERILKKTLTDSGIKSDQATELLKVAKKEFIKLTEEGDYVNEMSQMQAMQQQQAIAMQQNQMAMSNGQSPMGMTPQQGQDPSLMAMQQGADQSQMEDQEMEAQARHGGSMRRLHRFGAGGTCPEGFEWSEMVSSCMPSVSTSNTMQQGAGAMQFGAPQPQPNVKAGIDSYNQNAVARAQAADARTQAQGNYYANEIANFNNKRLTEQQNFQTALGGFLPQTQINTARDGGNINYLSRKDEGGSYDEYMPMENSDGDYASDDMQVPMELESECYEEASWPGGPKKRKKSCRELIEAWNKRKKRQDDVTRFFMNAGQTAVELGLAGGAAIGSGYLAKKESPWGKLMRTVGGKIGDFFQEDGGPVPAPTPYTPVGVNQYPQPDQGRTQDQGNTMGRDGGIKQYGPGGNQDGCPKGYYKGPDKDCLKIFGSDQADAEYQSQVVDFWNSGAPLDATKDNRAPMQTKAEFFSQNPAQDQMYANIQNQPNIPADTSQAAYQKYVNAHAVTNQGKKGAPPHLTYDQWKTGANPNTATMPTDPRLTGTPYIVETDKNKIANIDSNWVTRTFAKGNNLGNPQYAGLIGGFNPALKFLLGAGAVAGGAGLGIAKAFAGDRSRVYDDKGNVFYYNSKGDERRALKNGPQNQQNSSQSGYVTPTTTTVPVSGGSSQPTPQQVQQHQNSQLMLPGQTPIVTTANANATPTPSAAALNAVPGSNNIGPSVNNTPGPIPVQQSTTGPLQSDDPYAPNYNPNVPKTIKEDGGEWNPFVDNRRKLNISMPMYGPGGPVDTETSPYSEQEWAAKTGKTYPLDQSSLDGYNNYLNNFSIGSGNTTPANMNTSSMNPNTTNNANNALSANPNANKVDTKEYTIQRGDPLGFKVASNTVQGGIYMNDAVARINEVKGMQMNQIKQQQVGNTMAMGPINTQNSFGTINLNPGPGANQDVASLGHSQDWGTQLRFGGTKSYRQGGTYEISKEELRRIIEMGGQVEFLD